MGAAFVEEVGIGSDLLAYLSCDLAALSSPTALRNFQRPEEKG
ncbi:hypothetical protein [Haloferula sargassicola]